MRDARWKLNRKGELFDMSGAPFEERLVAEAGAGKEARDARQRLKAVLDRLDPASGILDNGDGTGRHASRSKDDGKSEE